MKRMQSKNLQKIHFNSRLECFLDRQFLVYFAQICRHASSTNAIQLQRKKSSISRRLLSSNSKNSNYQKQKNSFRVKFCLNNIIAQHVWAGARIGANIFLQFQFGQSRQVDYLQNVDNIDRRNDLLCRMCHCPNLRL